MDRTIASYIDHAVLAPQQGDKDVRDACRMCSDLLVASICVKPCHVPLAVELLDHSSVKVSTVIGFPHGSTSTDVKISEACWACQQGARELDMVVNLGKIHDHHWGAVEAEITAVVNAGRSSNAITKVIFETGLLNDDETIIQLCRISEQAGAAFVKTSTGFGFAKQDNGTMQSTGATEHHVRLMYKTCGPHMGVKASGGIRNLSLARRFVDLGATRLGTSSTLQIAAEERGEANTCSQENY